MAMQARLFINGRSQAVRIPKEYAFAGVDAVWVEKQGEAVILRPVRKTWDSLAGLDGADPAFMVLRPRVIHAAGGRR